ncbi:MAG: hypothetical protein RIB86_07160 [Imperialibacter sp.]
MLLEEPLHWASPESVEKFNLKIPFFKSLLKDMYAIIEAVYRKNGTFDIQDIEMKFKHFKEFRLLNNKLKHFENKSIEVDIISTNLIGYPNSPTYQEVLCQYKYKTGEIEVVKFAKFVLLFFTILEQHKLITVERA